MRSNSSFSNLCTLFLILSIILWGETSSYGQNGITHWKVPLEGKYATSWDTTDWDIRLLIDKPPMHVSIVSADSLRQIKSNNCKTALS